MKKLNPKLLLVLSAFVLSCQQELSEEEAILEGTWVNFEGYEYPAILDFKADRSLSIKELFFYGTEKWNVQDPIIQIGRTTTRFRIAGDTLIFKETPFLKEPIFNSKKFKKLQKSPFGYLFPGSQGYS